MVEKVDLSQCNCDKPGWCPIFNKEMGTMPPNWQWCQDCSQADRELHFEQTCKSVRAIVKSEDIDFANVINFYDELPEKKSNLAICVIPANDLAVEILNITRDSIKSYAERCGADYIELTGNQNPIWPMANKYRLHQVTSKYNKTLYLDCDVIISPNADNIFDETPNDKISAYDEYEVWQLKNETRWIEQQQDTIIRRLNEKELHDKYLDNGRTIFPNSMINGGVLVIPKSCSHYYQQPESPYPKHWCFDQNYLTLKLPKEKLHKLDFKWNCLYVSGDGFWYHAPDANFIHVNGLKDDYDARKAILQQVSYNDFCVVEPDRFKWLPLKPNFYDLVLDLKTEKFKKNKIGIVQSHLAPGGAMTWLLDFVRCFKKDITGVFAVENHEQFNSYDAGLKRAFTDTELYELYIKSDILIYWLYQIPETLPEFIITNPLKKKIIFLSHSSFRHNKSHDFMLKYLQPDVSVFVDEIVSNHYGGVCIPPCVEVQDSFCRTPIPKNILWHHRFDPYKGLSVLADLIRTMPDFNFHLAGNYQPGWISEEQRDLVEYHIIADNIPNVFFHNHLENMDNLFEMCSVSLSTSVDESFGLSVAESIVRGIPSVSHATGIGKYSDQVVKYNAHYTEWSAAIRLCEERNKEAKNKEYFKQEFSSQRFKSSWEKVLWK